MELQTTEHSNPLINSYNNYNLIGTWAPETLGYLAWGGCRKMGDPDFRNTNYSS